MKLHALRICVAGVGNNISALIQGIQLYQCSTDENEEMKGDISFARQIEFAAAFDVDPTKIGMPLNNALFLGSNNHPRYPSFDENMSSPIIEFGLTSEAGTNDVDRIVNILQECQVDILLLSLPTGTAEESRRYCQAALRARVAIVNCAPDEIARDVGIRDQFEAAGLPILGDDLASHFGSSLIHAALLRLMRERGVIPVSSYQVNLGGNEDFRNLRRRPEQKLASKLNVLQEPAGDSALTVIPSGGYIPQLGDHKVAYINLVGLGWAGAEIRVEVKLEVLDSSNAAAVIFELLRIARDEQVAGRGGFPDKARGLLKSPPAFRLTE